MRFTLFVLLVMMLTACSSGRVIITKPPVENYQRLGKTEGKACGTLGILATAYNAIPMGLNERYENACNDAISKVSGATGLIDVTLSESWFWWVIGTTRCVTVAGEAIK